MRWHALLVVLGFLGTFLLDGARTQTHQFSIAVKGSLTTGSQIFLNPNSPDEIKRAQFSSVKDIFGVGIEIRYRFPETDLAIALSTDYLRGTESSSERVSGSSIQIPIEDGYRVIPVELTGYFLIPISGEQLGVYMGGGAGAYFGRRVYSKARLEAPTIDAGHGYGIHVLSGISYRFSNRFSLLAEMKFRDLQFDSVNQFPLAQTIYGPLLVTLPTQPFPSRVHTDGMIFQLSAAFDL